LPGLVELVVWARNACDDRPMAPSTPPAPVVAVGVVALDPDGRLLMVERGRPPAAGTWSLPGGRVEPGETMAAAAVREAVEETGLVLELGEVAGVVERIGEGFHYVIVDFWAEVAQGAEPVGAGDAAAARLLRLDELPGLALAPGLGDFLQGIGCWPGRTSTGRARSAPIIRRVGGAEGPGGQQDAHPSDAQR
jgi:8-oxo-dGTP diphosphatase